MKSVFTLLLVFFQVALFGQSRIGGQVYTTNGPAPYATVALLKADSSLVKGTVSDSLGNFTLTAVPYGRYLVAASQVGAGKRYSAFFVADSLHPFVQLERLVLPLSTGLKEVEVKSQRPYVEQQIDKLVLNVENSVMAQGNTVYDVLVHAPGVKADKDDNLVMMGKPGVQIWIDGRPSNLSGESLNNWLKNQPADIVAKIELITNPSSRYDAAGSAGIINIRLKKNVQQGLNGSAYTGLTMGKYPKASAGVNMNYRKDKLNVFGNYSYSYSESFNYRTLNTVIHQQSKESYMDYDNYWHPFGNYHFVKVGADYKPTESTTIGVLVNTNFSSTNSMTDANTAVYDVPSAKDYLVARTGKDEKFRNLAYNLNLLHDIDTLGSSFNMDLDYSRYTRRDNEDILNWQRSGETGPQYLIATVRNATPSSVEALAYKADYTRYFSATMRMEAGFKLSHVNTDNDIRYDSLLHNEWEPDVNRSNQFVYTENIQAVYFSIAKEWKKLTVKAGLRVERTEATGHSITLNQKVKRDYTGFFPTVNLLQKINENNSITYSYSRRIDRPSYGSLNPFVMAIDPYNRSVGNPYLDASYTNTFEIRHGFKQFLWTTLYYSRGEKNSVNLITQDSITKIQTSTYQNLGSSDYGYLAVSVGVPVVKWWQVDFSGGVGYAKYTSNIPGNAFENGRWGAETSLDNTFTLPKDIRIMISMFYNTPAPSGQGVQRANYGGRMSASMPVFKKRGRVTFNLQDPFNMQRYDSDIYTNTSSIHWVNRWESRRVGLSFSWKFGSQQIKAVRDRKNSMSDVDRRVGM